MAVRKIKPFLNQISTFISNLDYALGLNVRTTPTKADDTIAIYEGSHGSDTIKLKFNSNHLDVVDEGKNPIVFCDTYLGFKGTEAGPINLSNNSESIDILYSALYEVGFRTEQDKKDEEELRKQKERKAQEEKERKAQEEKDRLARRREEILAQTEDEPEEDEAEEEIDNEEEKVNFDKYLEVLRKSNQPNSIIIAGITYSDKTSNFKMISIDMYYVTKDTCLVQTQGINPPIDKQVTWDKAKAYVFKVADKVNGSVSIVANNENGEEITIDKSNTSTQSNSSDLDLGIDI